jgi:transcriptional regulator with XRE-family HTH domain
VKAPKFADRLREVMLDYRPPLTQDALAERVGVTQAAVGGWLHGAIPYPSTLNRICLTLGVRRDWLLYGEGEKYLPKNLNIVREMPPTYSRREKITFIEEQAPELLPLVDAFLDSVRKKLGAGHTSKPSKKTRRSSR